MVRPKLPEIARGPIHAILLLLLSAGCTPQSSPPAPRLLLLVSVDTLRADRLGAYGSELGISPNLDAFAESSQVFEAAYAPTSFTLPSIGTLLTGRYPEEIGIVENRSALAPSIPTLATVLALSGWRSAAVVGNLVLRRNAGLAEGFDVYDDDLHDHESTRGWPERIARDTTDSALALLDGFPRDPDDHFFLWVHYQDPHGPYTPPGDLRERFLADERAKEDGRRVLPEVTGQRGRGHLPDYQVVDEQREVAFYRAGYDGEIHYLDSEFGRLLDALDERKLTPSTVVAFTADHGESLGERDYWFAHGDRLDDALVRVPLLLRVPGLAPARRYDIAGLVDVNPTLLQLVAKRPVDPDAPGRDLLATGAPAIDSVPYLATLGAGGPVRFGIVADGHKFVMTRSEHGWQRELYRIGYEERNLVDSDPERARKLQQDLISLREGLQTSVPIRRQRLSEQDQQNLRALGYLQAPETTPSD
jgi:arylsulfatase A-like enzyme